MTKRVISAILLAAILAVTACGGGSESSETTPSETTAETTPDVTTEAELEPVELDLGGQKFVIAENDIDDWTQSAFNHEENGDVLNDAIYKRNVTVEELYNIELEGYVIPGQRVGSNLTELKASILSGDKEFDIAYIPGQLTPVFLNSPDYLIPLNEVKNLDLSHSWWDQSSVETMTLFGKTIAANGDLILTTTGATTITAFNKEMAEEYKIDLYEIARSGQFTLDKAHELSQTVMADINGDGKYDPNDDRYGLWVETAHMPEMILAAGERLTTIGDDGVPKLALNTERAYDVVEKFIKVIDDYDCVISAQDNRLNGESVLGYDVMYNENRLFMRIMAIHALTAFRSFIPEFGMIPFPKYDESDEYCGPLSEYWASWLIVPATNTDENCGHIIDALGYYSQQIMTPAFIDSAVMVKSLRDDESAEMLEMVLPNKIYDIGSYMNWGYRILTGVFGKHNSNLASAVAENEAQIEAQIKTFVKQLKGE